MDQDTRFAEHAVIELMGHSQIIGYVTERSLGGANMLRVDVAEIEAQDGLPAIPAFTKYVSSAAVYSVNPCSEEFARVAAARLRAKPHNLYVPELFPPEAQAPTRRMITGGRYASAQVHDDFDEDDNEAYNAADGYPDRGGDSDL